MSDVKPAHDKIVYGEFHWEKHHTDYYELWRGRQVLGWVHRRAGRWAVWHAIEGMLERTYSSRVLAKNALEKSYGDNL